MGAKRQVRGWNDCMAVCSMSRKYTLFVWYIQPATLCGTYNLHQGEHTHTGVRVRHVEFDAYLTQQHSHQNPATQETHSTHSTHSNTGGGIQFSPAMWQVARQQALSAVGEAAYTGGHAGGDGDGGDDGHHASLHSMIQQGGDAMTQQCGDVVTQQGGDAVPTLILVDDNNYYRSMRRGVYRIARQGVCECE